jgi:hypothetical protein
VTPAIRWPEFEITAADQLLGGTVRGRIVVDVNR